MTKKHTSDVNFPEPRWPAFIALLADGIVCLALPDRLSVGPAWLLLSVVSVLLLPIVISHRTGRFDITKIFTLLANGVITVALISSLAFLVEGLPKHREDPSSLLRSACALWIANVIVFALWYWRLDAGGPHERERSQGFLDSSFLFPQMLMQDSLDKQIGTRFSAWSPQFMDYLFLAFNTSTAFSPTDTAILSRGAKLGTMAQSLISLLIIALLAARAVGIL
jgi:hypothetical protein